MTQLKHLTSLVRVQPFADASAPPISERRNPLARQGVVHLEELGAQAHLVPPGCPGCERASLPPCSLVGGLGLFRSQFVGRK